MIHVDIVFPLTTLLTWCGYHVAADRQEGICVRASDELQQSYNNIKQIEARHDDGWADIRFMKMVAKSTVFVDKSLLIKRIVETNEKVILINSPSRTGKSINLSMLKDFFEIRVRKSDGTVCPADQTSSYKFFTEGVVNTTEDDSLQRSYFYWTSAEEEGENLTATYTSPPMISKHENIVELYLSKYPVIYLDLKVRPIAAEQTILENMVGEICALYKTHDYLLQMLKHETANKNTTAVRRATARKHMADFMFYKRICVESHLMQPTHVENSLLILCKILREHFDQRVIVLIDEFVALRYYTFKDKDLMRQNMKRNLQQMKNATLRNLLKKTLQMNPYLEKAVLTGILSVNEHDLLADIVDLVHYTALDNPLQSFYGFTENEVDMLLDHFQIPDQLARQARTFYNGYAMQPNTDLVVYNMWSIVNFLNKKIVKGYWIEYSGTVKGVSHMIDVRRLRNIFQALIDGNDAFIYFTDVKFDLQDLQFFTKNIFYRRRVVISESGVNAILSLLCQIGVLTNGKHEFPSRTDNRTYSVRIPNEEIRRGMTKRLLTQENKL